MRSPIKLSLTGLLIAGAMAFGAVDAYAGASGNSRDAFIGIVGGNPGYYLGGGSYNYGPFNPGPDASSPYVSGRGGGNDAHDGGYYRGY